MPGHVTSLASVPDSHVLSSPHSVEEDGGAWGKHTGDLSKVTAGKRVQSFYS